MQLIIIPFSLASLAFLSLALVVVIVKTILFVKRFHVRSLKNWLYFSNYSIYATGKKQDRAWKNFQNWLTWASALFAMLSLLFLFLARS